MDPETKLKIVGMRYGEYGTADKTFASVKKIAETLDVNYAQVAMTLMRYRNRCRELILKPKKQRPKPVQVPLTPEQQSWVCKDQVLHGMLHLSLIRRCEQIRRTLGVQMNRA